MQKRLGIFGGTFDPIHMGHLIIAEMARQQCDLDKVLFIPAHRPPHKRGDLISKSNHRFKMSELATADNPSFIVSDMELRRKGISYTIDTLNSLRQVYPGDYEFWMIIGADSMLEIDSWKDSIEIIKNCGFAVYLRHNYPIKECKSLGERIQKLSGLGIQFIKAPKIEISSSDIRERLARSETIRYMVPEKVRDYIIKNSLFVVK